MALMDRVIWGKGCSFSALIALKLFGGKGRKASKKDMDFDDALDEMLTEELEEDDLKNPFQWYYLNLKLYITQTCHAGISSGN